MRLLKMFVQASVPASMSILLLSCGEKKDNLQQKKNQPTVVDVIIATAKPIHKVVEVNGTVAANDYVDLKPEVAGRVTYLNIPEGKKVQKGTILVRLNDADLQAQMAKSKVQLDLAEKTEERLRKLLTINGVNQADYDNALNQVNNIKADIGYYQALIDKTIIKAPFNGLVGLRQISLGAYIAPTINIIASLQEIDQIKIDFTVPEEYISIIHKGLKVEITTESAPDKKFTATVFAIEPQINITTRNLKVRALLHGNTLNPGAFAKVHIEASGNKASLMVPSNSLIPDDRNNQIIIVKNGKANFVPVKTGVRQAGNVEITQGVEPGDTIVVTGVLFARPKSDVKIRSIKTLEQLTPHD